MARKKKREVLGAFARKPVKRVFTTPAEITHAIKPTPPTKRTTARTGFKMDGIKTPAQYTVPVAREELASTKSSFSYLLTKQPNGCIAVSLVHTLRGRGRLPRDTKRTEVFEAYNFADTSEARAFLNDVFYFCNWLF